jgi:hypothetical protein
MNTELVSISDTHGLGRLSNIDIDPKYRFVISNVANLGITDRKMNLLL